MTIIKTRLCILATDLARALLVFSPSSTEGAGNAGCTLAPAVSCATSAKESAHEHTGEAEAIRHPLRDGLTAYTGLSLVTGFLATIIHVMRSIPRT
jgi:hypothetical protein